MGLSAYFVLRSSSLPGQVIVALVSVYVLVTVTPCDLGL